MFVVVFVVCNLLTGECQPMTPESVAPTERACHMVAEYAQNEAKDALPPYATVDYKCVQFDEPA